ncbi:MAG: pirin family protein [Flavobacteriaceae bacterium]
MKTVLHRSETRGHANHGWLNAKHSFSFANYYDPERIHFGALRVLNDDIVAPGMGFGSHPHDNMEIITIPLEGDLEHKDSMGCQGVIKAGDVQVISAGTGIYHSEFNHNPDLPINLLQIWIFPNKKEVEPRYEQMSIRDLQTPNQFYQILSPNPDDVGVWIHQDSWFYLGDFDTATQEEYVIKKEGNGVYAFVIKGSMSLGGQTLNERDALGIWDADSFSVSAEANSRILLIEVPMQL